jgi:hypothetical protein
VLIIKCNLRIEPKQIGPHLIKNLTDKLSMKTWVLIPIIYFFMTAAFAADPCYQDFKSQKCFEHLSKELFFSDWDNSLSIPHKKYVDAYYKKYGYKGLLYQDPKGRTLAHNLLSGLTKSPLKNKFIRDFPKGELITGENIFQVMLSRSAASMNNVGFVENLEALFPAQGNEDLKYTNERFGLPWGDPNFLSGYVGTIEGEIKDIERRQQVFKDKTDEDIKIKLKEILNRIKPYADIPDQVCKMTTSEELKNNIEKYPTMFKSTHKDIVGCLLKNNQCQLAKELIDSGNYLKENLVSYFNQLSSLSGSPSCAETTKIVYMAMVDENQKTDKFFQEKGLLKKMPDYFEKYPEALSEFCDAPIGGGRNNILSLEKSFLDVMNLHAHDLLKKMIKEKDPKKQDELLSEFVELMGLMSKQAKRDPRNNKTMLEVLADAGAHELLERILKRDINSYDLDDINPYTETDDVLGKAIASDDLNKLKFAFVLYNDRRSQDSIVVNTRHQLKKLHSKDPAIQEYRKVFRDTVQFHYLHIY